MTRCSQGILPLAVFGETGSENQTVFQENSPGCLVAFVCDGLFLDFTGPEILIRNRSQIQDIFKIVYFLIGGQENQSILNRLEPDLGDAKEEI